MQVGQFGPAAPGAAVSRETLTGTGVVLTPLAEGAKVKEFRRLRCCFRGSEANTGELV